jgi:glycosyltransferase involved in cell wall biosynthesis
MSGNIKNKFVIITPFYNPGEFLEKCISSIITQRYDNYKIVFIDDMSIDDSWDKLPHDDERAICIKNTVRKTALENIHNAIMNHCDKDDICVLVDGDDWLYNKNVLNNLNIFYNVHDCWISYGQSSWTDGRRGFASAYPESEFSNLRKAPFRVSHIRTFRAGLYQKIQEQDKDFSCMKDSNGEFYKMTYDVAIMFPIMEMAGYDKVKFNDTILYVYNRSNPISDDRVNQQLQWDIHAEISNKPFFNKIENYI